jgi:hypothetical protein
MLPDLNNNKKHAQGTDFHGFLSKHVTFALLRIKRRCFYKIIKVLLLA